LLDIAMLVCELLPEIDIAISGEGRKFLVQMALLGRESGDYVVEKHLDAESQLGLRIVNFRYLKESVHTDVGFQLISSVDSPSRVAVEVRALSWSPDPPTKAAYVDAARSLVGPLLTSFNRANNKRYRLIIERATRRQIKVSATTRRLFDRFAKIANASAPHPLDWRRFYEFVRCSRQELPEHVVRALLIERSFPNRRADKIAELYGHLWAYKRLS
jgi:hypothetical protein